MRLPRFAFIGIMACGLVPMLARCGRLADDAEGGVDGDTDAPNIPCTSGVFGAPLAIAELNTPTEDERGLRFTPDELVAVFSRQHATDAKGYPPFDIYRASRTTRSMPLKTPEVFPAQFDINQLTYIQLYPNLAGSWLLVESLCRNPQLQNQSPLCIYIPPDGGTTQTGFINDGIQPGIGPFGVGGFAFGDGFVTWSGNAYYFAGLTSDDGGLSGGYNPLNDSGTPPTGQAIFVARPTHLDDPTSCYGCVPNSVTRLTAEATLLLDNPVTTADELTMYASATTSSDPTSHVYVATRASTNDPFIGFTPVHELDSSEGEYPSWISPDRCRLYLSRRVGGQWDVYVASRSP